MPPLVAPLSREWVLMNVDGCATYSNHESIDESIYHEVDVSTEHRHADLSVRSSLKP
jgi:hypothetical protein